MLRPDEKLVFQVFYEAHPHFAGRQMSWADGADPPDVLCTDSVGKLIGVELGEWLNEAEIRSNKRRERWQDSYLKAIRSEEEAPPRNFGMVWLRPKPGVHLSTSDGPVFRQELFRLLSRVDGDWPVHPEWHRPRGRVVGEFPSYPCLTRYLMHVRFHPKWGSGVALGTPWVGFRPRADAYSPGDAVDALLELLREKTAKYSGLHARQSLTELYLIAYYNKALFYNSPYVAPGFALPEVARIATDEVAKNPGPFQKIFLFNATNPGLDVFQLWPAV
jgi:hypothetical protein